MCVCVCVCVCACMWTGNEHTHNAPTPSAFLSLLYDSRPCLNRRLLRRDDPKEREEQLKIMTSGSVLLWVSDLSSSSDKSVVLLPFCLRLQSFTSIMYLVHRPTSAAAVIDRLITSHDKLLLFKSGVTNTNKENRILAYH